MSLEKISTFLAGQKQRMLKLDKASGFLERERNGFDWSKEQENGKRIGLRESLYNNTIDWILSQRNGVLREDFLSLSQPGVISEDTTTSNIATLVTSLLPAVRRLYSSLIALDLVSVQPLQSSTGKIWYADFKYGDDYEDESIEDGDRLDQTKAENYSDSSEQGTIRSIDFALTAKSITTSIKKLKAEWTLESEQDARAEAGINLESELMDKVTLQIKRELDAELISALVAGVATSLEFNVAGYLDDDKSTWERKEYKRTLYEKIVEMDSEVRKLKYRGLDWLLMDEDVFERLENLSKFEASSIGPNGVAVVSQNFEGTLNKKWKIYVSPDMTANTILGGLRGDWQHSVGYYAPYIPLFVSNKYMISDDFTQFARGAMCRYDSGIIPETKTASTNNGLAKITLTSS